MMTIKRYNVGSVLEVEALCVATGRVKEADK